LMLCFVPLHGNECVPMAVYADSKGNVGLSS
jgi:hypothetical protein